MCGRYVNPATAEAERYFAVHLIRWKFDRSYNVAPTQQVPVVRRTDGQREGLMMRWGLVPFEARVALKPYPDDLMHAQKVSTRVISPKNNHASLIEPAPLDPGQFVRE